VSRDEQDDICGREGCGHRRRQHAMLDGNTGRTCDVQACPCPGWIEPERDGDEGDADLAAERDAAIERASQLEGDLVVVRGDLTQARDRMALQSRALTQWLAAFDAGLMLRGNPAVDAAVAFARAVAKPTVPTAPAGLVLGGDAGADKLAWANERLCILVDGLRAQPCREYVHAIGEGVCATCGQDRQAHRESPLRAARREIP
jgi:hypothetical protein